MAGFTLSQLEADIRSYTEVDSNVLTGAILGRLLKMQNLEFFMMFPATIIDLLVKEV